MRLSSFSSKKKPLENKTLLNVSTLCVHTRTVRRGFILIQLEGAVSQQESQADLWISTSRLWLDEKEFYLWFTNLIIVNYREPHTRRETRLWLVRNEKYWNEDSISRGFFFGTSFSGILFWFLGNGTKTKIIYARATIHGRFSLKQNDSQAEDGVSLESTKQ